MKAEDAVWDKFLQAQNMTLEYHLKFLGCTENMNIVEKHINYVKSMRKKFFSKNTYSLIIFRNIFKNPSNTDPAIDFFINNTNKFSEK